MRLNDNYPPGVTDADISSPHECQTCEGFGRVEVASDPDDDDGSGEIPSTAKTQVITCPDCSGLGVSNTRAAR